MPIFVYKEPPVVLLANRNFRVKRIEKPCSLKPRYGPVGRTEDLSRVMCWEALPRYFEMLKQFRIHKGSGHYSTDHRILTVCPFVHMHIGEYH